VERNDHPAEDPPGWTGGPESTPHKGRAVAAQLFLGNHGWGLAAATLAICVVGDALENGSLLLGIVEGRLSGHSSGGFLALVRGLSMVIEHEGSDQHRGDDDHGGEELAERHPAQTNPGAGIQDYAPGSLPSGREGRRR
jgi:hypothetical protein